MDRRAIILGVVGVVALAAVVFVLAALAPSDAPTPVTSSKITAEQGAAAFAADAQEALAAGRSTQAAELAARALALDPANEAAQEVMRSVTASAAPDDKPASTPDPGKKPVSGQADPFAATTADLTKLLPNAAPEYQLGAATTIKPDATVSGTPLSAGTVSLAVWSVHDKGSEAAAKEFITKTSKVAYPTAGSSVTVGGVDGYFGTDGTRYASVSFARGRYAFEVVLTSTGPAPDTLRQAALNAAEAFPDRMP